MKKIIKHLLNPFIGKYLERRGEEKQIKAWIAQGMPAPPVHVYKRSVIRDLQKQFRIECFVETGTYKGEMIEAVLNYFTVKHSVELHQQLFDDAKAKFESRDDVKLWHGDSGSILKIILKDVRTPALFWLDGHYSGEGTARGNTDTPIMNELADIAHHALKSRHVVLIDDAHCFNGSNGYPDISQLQKTVGVFFPDHNCLIEHNIIRILPKNEALTT
jgi:hypothetical protein